MLIMRNFGTGTSRSQADSECERLANSQPLLFVSNSDAQVVKSFVIFLTGALQVQGNACFNRVFVARYMLVKQLKMSFYRWVIPAGRMPVH